MGNRILGEIDIKMEKAPLFPNEVAFDLSSNFPATKFRIVHLPAGVREASWHTPPGRVLAVWLNGTVEFETSDNEVRRVSAGGIVLVEDTRGRGHISRHPADGQTVILISLPESLTLNS
jgi:oxalate decarboxylase/phosphoglucose isomerase-like protein (cupin superfamily)